MKFRGVIPRAHFPRNFGGTLDTLVVYLTWGYRHPLIRSTDPDPAGHLTCGRIASSDRENPFDRGRIGRVDTFEPTANRPTRDRNRRTCQSSGIGRIDLRTELVESVSFVGEQFGLANEDGNEVAARCVVHRWEQIEPDAIAQERAVRIGRVLERGPAESIADFDRFCTPEVEQGMENAPGRPAEDAHSGESIESRSAQEIDDHCFGTVIRCVTRAHVLGEDGVASRTCARLEIRSGFDMDTV